MWPGVRAATSFSNTQDDPSRWATVVVHGNQILKLGTLLKILHTAELTKEQFTDLLRDLRPSIQCHKPKQTDRHWDLDR